MKKFMVAALFVGLVSGTAGMAVETLTTEEKAKMPAEVKDVLQKVEAGQIKGTLPSDIAQYIINNDEQIKKNNTTLEQIYKKKGYDPYVDASIHQADSLLDGIKQYDDSIKTNAQNAANNFASVDAIIKMLDSYNPPPPTTFPEKCVNYRENEVEKAIIELSNTKYVAKLCFSESKNRVSCANPSIVKYIVQYQFASDAGSITGESIDDIPPTRPTDTVYFTQTPTPDNGKTSKVQCFARGSK